MWSRVNNGDWTTQDHTCNTKEAELAWLLHRSTLVFTGLGGPMWSREVQKNESMIYA